MTLVLPRIKAISRPARFANGFDRLAWAMAALSAFLLAGIVAMVCFEVGARYLFNSPTRWASDFVGYALCWAVFCAAPLLTRKNAHVSITFLPDLLPSDARRRYTAAVASIAALCCFIVAGIGLLEVQRQMVSGVTTVAAITVPKWLISLPIFVGLMGTGIAYVLNVLQGPLTDEEEEPSDVGH